MQNYNSEIKYCGAPSQKQFTIALNAGRIYAADSCFGYSFEIGFNPTKVRVDSKLIMNTLAELFEYSDATFHKEGYVRGYAANLKNKIVYGDKPLMAFYCTFLSDCEDTANFTINYVEFTEEFKGTVDTLTSLNVKIDKNLTTKDSTNIYPEPYSLDFNGLEKKTVLIKAEVNSQKAYKNFMMVLSKGLDNSNYKINNIKLISPVDAKIDSIYDNGLNNNLKTTLFTINNSKLKQQITFAVEIETILNKDKMSSIGLLLDVNENCDCINYYGLTNLALFAKEKKDTTSAVEVNNNDEISQNGNYLRINEGISKISIYNICGILISEINTENNSQIDLSELNDGVYFLVYDFEKMRKNRKIFINKF